MWEVLPANHYSPTCDSSDGGDLHPPPPPRSNREWETFPTNHHHDPPTRNSSDGGDSRPPPPPPSLVSRVEALLTPPLTIRVTRGFAATNRGFACHLPSTTSPLTSNSTPRGWVAPHPSSFTSNSTPASRPPSFTSNSTPG